MDRMSDAKQSQEELLQGLVDAGFITSVAEGLNASSKYNRNSASHKIVAAAFCAGLYPQLAKVSITRLL